MPKLMRRHWFVLAALITTNVLFFTFVDPRQTSAVLLMIGFLLLALNMLLAARFIARVTGVPSRIAMLGALIMIAMLGLQSIGQLTVRDVSTLVPLVALGYAYMTYGKRQATD